MSGWSRSPTASWLATAMNSSTATDRGSEGTRGPEAEARSAARGAGAGAEGGAAGEAFEDAGAFGTPALARPPSGRLPRPQRRSLPPPADPALPARSSARPRPRECAIRSPSQAQTLEARHVRLACGLYRTQEDLQRSYGPRGQVWTGVLFRMLVT